MKNYFIDYMYFKDTDDVHLIISDMWTFDNDTHAYHGKIISHEVMK